MKILFFAFLFLQPLFGDTPPAGLLKRSNGLVNDRIPKLSLKDATLAEAIEVIQKEWSAQHEGDPLPIALVDFNERDPKSGIPRITLDAHNIPFIQALIYLSEATKWRFSVKRALPSFELPEGIAEDWETKPHPISRDQLVALGLNPKSSSDEARKAMIQHGLDLQDWESVGLLSEGKVLLLTSDAKRQTEWSGILALLSKGYKITR